MVQGRYVFPFSQLRMTDVDRVGGKNASLGELLSQLTSAGIRVPDHADSGVVGEHPLEADGHLGRAVGDDHLARVQRVSDAHASAVMERHPARSRGGPQTLGPSHPRWAVPTAAEVARRCALWPHSQSGSDLAPSER